MVDHSFSGGLQEEIHIFFKDPSDEKALINLVCSCWAKGHLDYLLSPLSEFPHLKFQVLRTLTDILKYHRKPYLSKISCFLTPEFLSSLKFSDLPLDIYTLLQSSIWELSKESKSDLDQITSIYSRAGYNLQILPDIGYALIVDALNAFSANEFAKFAKAYKLSVYSPQCNGLISVFKSSCDEKYEKFNAILELEYPQIFDENMKSIISWVFTCEYIGNDEKFKCFKDLSQVLSKEDFEKALFTVDSKGHYGLSGLVMIGDIDLIKKVLNLTKEKLCMEIDEIVNAPYEMHKNGKIFKTQDYLKRTFRWRKHQKKVYGKNKTKLPFCLKKKIKNKQAKDRAKFTSESLFAPVNLVEVALYNKDEIVALYLVSIGYKLRHEGIINPNYERIVLRCRLFSLLESSLELSFTFEDLITHVVPDDFLDSRVFSIYSKVLEKFLQNDSGDYLTKIFFPLTKKGNLIYHVIKKDDFELFSHVFPTVYLAQSDSSYKLLFYSILYCLLERKNTKIFESLIKDSFVKEFIKNLSSFELEDTYFFMNLDKSAFSNHSLQAFLIKTALKFKHSITEFVEILTEDAFIIENARIFDTYSYLLNKEDYFWKNRYLDTFYHFLNCCRTYISWFLNVVERKEMKNLIEERINTKKFFTIPCLLFNDNDLFSEERDLLSSVYWKFKKFYRVIDVHFKNMSSEEMKKAARKIFKNIINISEASFRYNERTRWFNIACKNTKKNLPRFEIDLQEIAYSMLKKSISKPSTKKGDSLEYLLFQMITKSHSKRAAEVLEEIKIAINPQKIGDMFRLFYSNVLLGKISNTLPQKFRKKFYEVRYSSMSNEATGNWVNEIDDKLALILKKVLLIDIRNYPMFPDAMVAFLKQTFCSRPELLPRKVYHQFSVSENLGLSPTPDILGFFKKFINAWKNNEISSEVKYSNKFFLFPLLNYYYSKPIGKHDKLLLKILEVFKDLPKVIKLLLENENQVFEFFFEDLKDETLLLKALKACTYYGREKEFEIIKKSFKYDDSLQEIMFIIAIIGKNRYFIEFLHKSFRGIFDFYGYDVVQLHNEDYLSTYDKIYQTFACFTSKTIQHLAHFCDPFLFEALPQFPVSSILSTILEYLKGHNNICHKCRFPKLVQSHLAEFPSHISNFISILKNISHDTPLDNDIDKELFINLCHKSEIWSLLEAAFDYLYDEKSELLLKTALMTFIKSNEEKFSLFKKILAAGYTEKVLNYVLDKKVKLVDNKEYLQWALENYPEDVIKVGNRICEYIGDYEFMKKLKGFSLLGIIKYCDVQEVKKVLEAEPIVNLKEIFRLAVKNRKLEILKYAIEFLSPFELADILQADNGECAFELAFYCQDAALKYLLQKLGPYNSIFLNNLYRDGYSLLHYRLLCGKYSDAWEPLVESLKDWKKENSKLISLYLEKILKEKFSLLKKIDSRLLKQRKFKKFNDNLHEAIIKSNNPCWDKSLLTLCSAGIWPSDDLVDWAVKIKCFDACDIYFGKMVENELEIKKRDYIENNAKPEYKAFHNYLLLLSLHGSPRLLKYTIPYAMSNKILEILLSYNHIALFFALIQSQNLSVHNPTELLQDTFPCFSIRSQLRILISYYLLQSSNHDQICNLVKNHTIHQLHFAFIEAKSILKDLSNLTDAPKSMDNNFFNEFIVELRNVENSLKEKFSITTSFDLQEFPKKMNNVNFCLLFLTYLRALKDIELIKDSCGIKEISVEANASTKEDLGKIENGKIKVSINFEENDQDVNFIDVWFSEKMSNWNALLDKEIKNFGESKKLSILAQNCYGDEERNKEWVYYLSSKTNSLSRLIDNLKSYPVNNLTIDENKVKMLGKNFKTCSYEEFGKSFDFILSLLNPAFTLEKLILKETDEPAKYPNTDNEVCFTFYKEKLNYKILQTPKFIEQWAIKIHKSSYLPFVVSKAREALNLFAEQFKNLRNSNIIFDAENYINSIAIPISKAFSIDICQVISSHQEVFLTILKHFSITMSLFPKLSSSIQGVFIDFTNDSKSMSLHIDHTILIYRIPFALNIDSSLENSIIFTLPKLQHLIDDVLIHLKTPQQIVSLILQPRYLMKKVIRKNKDIQNLVKVDWESIIAGIIGSLDINKNYKGAIESLRIIREQIESLLYGITDLKIYNDNAYDEMRLIRFFDDEVDRIAFGQDNKKTFWIGNGRKKICPNDEDNKQNGIVSVLECDPNKKEIFVETLAGNLFRVKCFEKCDIGKIEFKNYFNLNNLCVLNEKVLISTSDKSDVQIVIPESKDQKEKDVAKSYNKRTEKLKWVTKKNTSWMKINQNYNEFKLKSCFWYFFNLEKDELNNNFCRHLNYSRKIRKAFYCKKTFLLRPKIIVKTHNWTMSISVNWESFNDKTYLYNQCKSLSSNILDKVKNVILSITSLYNFLNTSEGFSTANGNIYFKPKDFLLRKIVSKHLSQITFIIKTTEDVILTNDVITIGINPETCFKDSDFNRKIILDKVVDIITQKEIEQLDNSKVEIISKSSDDSNEDSEELLYIENIEKLVLISQVPMLLKLSSLASRLYADNFPIRIALDMNNRDKIPMPVKTYYNDAEYLTFTYCCNFYNIYTFQEIAENIRARPYNSLYTFNAVSSMSKCRKVAEDNAISEIYKESSIKRAYDKLLRSKYRYFVINESQVSGKYDYVFPTKYMINKKFYVRLIKFQENKDTTKVIFVAFYRSYPVYFRNLGCARKAEVKKPTCSLFCMRRLESNYRPIINEDNFFGMFFHKGKINIVFVKKTINFVCYIVADKEYEISVRNSKGTVVESKMEKIEENSEWDGLPVYKLTFETLDKGYYYITHQGSQIPSDFVLKRKKTLPISLKLVYSKLNLSFELNFKNCNLYLSLRESTFNSYMLKDKILNIDLKSQNQSISFNKSFTSNSLIITFLRPLSKEYIMTATLDSIHVEGSPIKIILADSFHERYMDFMKQQQLNMMYSKTLKISLDNQDILDAIKNTFWSMRQEKIIATKKQTIKNKKKIRHLNFFKIVRNFLLEPTTKIFKDDGGKYRLEKNVGSSLYSLSSIFVNAIIHMEDLPLQLHPRMFSKTDDMKILNKSQLAKKLNDLKKLSSEELKNANIKFTVEDKGEIFPLVTDGENNSVESWNLDNFIQYTANWEYYNCSNDAIRAFQMYFEQFFSNFNRKELKTIVYQGHELLCEILKSKIKCGSSMKLQKNSIIKWISHKSCENLKNFLEFVTGSPYINFINSNWHINLRRLPKTSLPFELKTKMELPYCYKKKNGLKSYLIQLPKADKSSNTLYFPMITDENLIDISMRIAMKTKAKK
ncbi:hypothetical protein SteCoe_34573 [Stentor coeruleus]|uniref:Uncharacterized protein n=1 Tax=Stentor coeruleus TaxID=5963 RepID=A0A1R2AU75_9CILI|nr:hypothetical protein SteCoe_34573 [Stentor coeruleus]